MDKRYIGRPSLTLRGLEDLRISNADKPVMRVGPGLGSLIVDRFESYITGAFMPDLRFGTNNPPRRWTVPVPGTSDLLDTLVEITTDLGDYEIEFVERAEGH